MAARTDALISRTGLSYRRKGRGAAGAGAWLSRGGGAVAGEIDRFADRFDVIAPDLPGFAGSATLPPADRIADFAAAVVALLDELGGPDHPAGPLHGRHDRAGDLPPRTPTASRG